MGFTIPLVPRMEMPPTMPSRGLKVRFARASPSGTEITARRPPVYPALAAALSSAFYYLPMLKAVSSGWSIILVTLAVSGLAALLFPIDPERGEEKQ